MAKLSSVSAANITKFLTALYASIFQKFGKTIFGQNVLYATDHNVLYATDQKPVI